MRSVVGFFTLCLLLSSCAIHRPDHLNLPPETSFNHTAGCGDWLYLKLRMENGTVLANVFLDTGGPHTVLDKSLEPLLGKRIGTGTWYEPFLGGFVKVNLYNAPKLCLGGIPLLTDSRVYTYDLQKKFPGI